MGGAQVGGLAHGDDFLIADEYCAVLEDAEAAEVAAALRPALQCKELSGGVDEHGSF